jgi:hypothetical protein
MRRTLISLALCAVLFALSVPAEAQQPATKKMLKEREVTGRALGMRLKLQIAFWISILIFD